MGIFRKVIEIYQENPMTIEEWEKLNNLKHDNIEIDWETGIAYNKPVDFCVFMCCYEKINRTDDGGFVNPPLHFGLDSKPKESMDNYTKKVEMKIWHETYLLHVSTDGIIRLPIERVFENCDRAVKEFRKSVGI